MIESNFIVCELPPAPQVASCIIAGNNFRSIDRTKRRFRLAQSHSTPSARSNGLIAIFFIPLLFISAMALGQSATFVKRHSLANLATSLKKLRIPRTSLSAALIYLLGIVYTPLRRSRIAFLGILIPPMSRLSVSPFTRKVLTILTIFRTMTIRAITGISLIQVKQFGGFCLTANGTFLNFAARHWVDIRPIKLAAIRKKSLNSSPIASICTCLTGMIIVGADKCTLLFLVALEVGNGLLGITRNANLLWYAFVGHAVQSPILNGVVRSGSALDALVQTACIISRPIVQEV